MPFCNKCGTEIKSGQFCEKCKSFSSDEEYIEFVKNTILKEYNELTEAIQTLNQKEPSKENDKKGIIVHKEAKTRIKKWYNLIKKMKNDFERTTAETTIKEFERIVDEGLVASKGAENKNIPKESKLSKKSIDASLVCPYCKDLDNQFIVKVNKDEDEYECPKCKKMFKAMFGEVIGASGIRGYVAQQANIRIKTLFGEERLISYYATHQGLEIRKGDEIAIIFKKGIMGGYKDKPEAVLNHNIGTCHFGL